MTRQRAADVAWSVLGGLIGGAATTAFAISKYRRALRARRRSTN